MGNRTYLYNTDLDINESILLTEGNNVIPAIVRLLFAADAINLGPDQLIICKDVFPDEGIIGVRDEEFDCGVQLRCSVDQAIYILNLRRNGETIKRGISPKLFSLTEKALKALPYKMLILDLTEWAMLYENYKQFIRELHESFEPTLDNKDSTYQDFYYCLEEIYSNLKLNWDKEYLPEPVDGHILSNDA